MKMVQTLLIHGFPEILGMLGYNMGGMARNTRDEGVSWISGRLNLSFIDVTSVLVSSMYRFLSSSFSSPIFNAFAFFLLSSVQENMKARYLNYKN